MPAIDCPFCHNSIKKSVFAETDHFYAVYNISPILPGHSLVIPKTHCVSFLDLSDEERADMINFSAFVIKKLMKAFDSDGFDLTIQDGKSAGQTVMHLHTHLIPRQKNDLKSPGNWYPKLLNSRRSSQIDSNMRNKLSECEIHRVVTHLKKAFIPKINWF